MMATTIMISTSVKPAVLFVLICITNLSVVFVRGVNDAKGGLLFIITRFVHELPFATALLNCSRRGATVNLSVNRPFGVPALAGLNRLKAGLQTSGVPQTGSRSQCMRKNERGRSKNTTNCGEPKGPSLGRKGAIQ